MTTKIMLAMAAMAVAFAQGPGGPGGPGGPPPQGGPAMLDAGQAAPQAPSFDEIKAYLSLTDAQITAMQAGRQSVMEGLKSVHDQIQAKSEALRTLLDNGTTDASAVGKAVLEIETLRKQVESTLKSAQAQLVSALTADQKTKLAALEAAARLQPAIAQAGQLGLLAPPQNAPRP